MLADVPELPRAGRDRGAGARPRAARQVPDPLEVVQGRDAVGMPVDGTLCERKRGSGLSDREKRRYALEARIITPWGWDIPLLTEAVEAYDGEKEKQDCEYRAFERLAARLRKLFPRQAFCIVGDSLYCSHPIMDICRRNKWEFILTFKEGAMPKVYKAVQSAKLRVGGFDWAKAKDASGAEKTVGVFSWVDAMECAYELGEGEDFRVVSFSGWDASECGGRYDGAFATSFGALDAKRALVVAAWGLRPRAHLLQRRHGGAQLPRSHADRLHAVAGVRNGRPLPALRGLPQALAGDVGEDALRGDPRPRPRVGSARRGRRDADAAVPPRRLKSDGERRPDLNAVAMIPSLPAGERGMFAFEFQPPRLCAAARDKKTSRQTRQENPVP